MIRSLLGNTTGENSVITWTSDGWLTLRPVTVPESAEYRRHFHRDVLAFFEESLVT